MEGRPGFEPRLLPYEGSVLPVDTSGPDELGPRSCAAQANHAAQLSTRVVSIGSDYLLAWAAKWVLNAINVVARSVSFYIVAFAGIQPRILVALCQKNRAADIAQRFVNVGPQDFASEAVKSSPRLFINDADFPAVEIDEFRFQASRAARHASVVVCVSSLKIVSVELGWSSRNWLNTLERRLGACIRSFAGTLPIYRAARSELCKHREILA